MQHCYWDQSCAVEELVAAVPSCVCRYHRAVETEGAVRVRETAEATTQAQAGASRQTMRRFDVRLPANFNIPR